MNWRSSVASANASIRAWSIGEPGRRRRPPRRPGGGFRRGWQAASAGGRRSGIGHDHRSVRRRGEGCLGRVSELRSRVRRACAARRARPRCGRPRPCSRRRCANRTAARSRCSTGRSRGWRSERSVQPLRASTAALDQRRHLFELVRRSLVDHPERKRRAAAAPGVEIVNFAFEQLGVGHDHLLAGDRAQPGGLEADPFDGSGGLVVAGWCRRAGTACRTGSKARRTGRRRCLARRGRWQCRRCRARRPAR